MDPPGGQLTTPIDELGDFAALDPFFRIIEEGLAGFVDGPGVTAWAVAMAALGLTKQEFAETYRRASPAERKAMIPQGG